MKSSAKQVTPRVTCRFFPAGEECNDPQPGDLLLVQHASFIAGTIRFGERLRGWLWQHGDKDRKKFTWTNHAAMINANCKVSEQAADGNQVVDLQTYVHDLYAVVHFDDATREQVKATLDFIDANRTSGYGWLSIFAGIVPDILTNAKFSVGWGNRMICSTMAYLCSVPQGLIADRLPESVMPSDLARYVGAVPPPYGFD